MSKHLNSEDLILYKEGKNILTTGYKINSFYLDNYLSPIKSINSNDNSSELSNENKINKPKKVSELFSNLAIPSGLFSIERNKILENNNFKLNNSNKILDSTIFDKLLSSESLKKSKYYKTTRRNKNKIINNKNKNKKGTRKNI